MEEAADFEEMWSVEPDSGGCVFCLRCQRSPGAVQLLSEVGGEVLGAEIDEAVALRLKHGRGPGVTLVSVADAAGIVEVIEVVDEACESRERLRPEMIQLEVALASGHKLVEKAVGTALCEVFANEGPVL